MVERRTGGRRREKESGQRNKREKEIWNQGAQGDRETGRMRKFYIVLVQEKNASVQWVSLAWDGSG